MNKLVIAAALSALLASPALAQADPETSVTYPMMMDNNAPPPADDGLDANASYIEPGFGDVSVDGTVVGRDPDANIRLQLLRDPVPTTGNDN